MSRNANRSKSGDRWTESILRRRKAIVSADSESSSSLSKDSIGSPVSTRKKSSKSTSFSSPDPRQMTFKSCDCGHRCKEPASRQKFTLLNSQEIDKKGTHGGCTIQEKLKMKICDNQGQIVTDSSHQNALKNTLHHVKTALSFVAHYSECLELQYHTNVRLRHLICSVLPNPSEKVAESMKSLKTVDQGNSYDDQQFNVYVLKEVAQRAMMAAEHCERLAVFQDDYRAKRSDFLLASHNFRHLLGNRKVTGSQLRKLEAQYCEILTGYRESRNVLEHEISKIVNNRKEILSECFQTLSRWLEHLEKISPHLVQLFSCLGEDLKSTFITDTTPTESSETMPPDTSACGEPGPNVSCTCSCPERFETEDMRSRCRSSQTQ